MKTKKVLKKPDPSVAKTKEQANDCVLRLPTKTKAVNTMKIEFLSQLGHFNPADFKTGMPLEDMFAFELGDVEQADSAARNLIISGLTMVDLGRRYTLADQALDATELYQVLRGLQQQVKVLPKELVVIMDLLIGHAPIGFMDDAKEFVDMINLVEAWHYSPEYRRRVKTQRVAS